MDYYFATKIREQGKHLNSANIAVNYSDQNYSAIKFGRQHDYYNDVMLVYGT